MLNTQLNRNRLLFALFCLIGIPLALYQFLPQNAASRDAQIEEGSFEENAVFQEGDGKHNTDKVGDSNQAPNELNWAILTDEATRISGFPDLLAVELTNAGYSMIERDQIPQLDDEMLLGVTSARSSLSQSFELGKRVGANRLVLCKLLNGQDPPLIRVVVCDCDQAARIGVLDFQLHSADELSKGVAQFIESVRIQFEAGIQRVVGLAPFGCKNLGPDFAPLGQTGFDSIADQLLSIPGVALVEWESARELTKELNSLDGIDRRRVPAIIEVDYQVIPGNDEKPPAVELSLSIQSGGKPKQTSATVALSDMDRWLRQQIVPNLIADKNANQRLSKEVQLQQLKSRAANLFRLGDVAHCTQVREVVLQIAPNDAVERRRIIDDYALLPSRSSQNEVLPTTPLKIYSQSSSREHFEFLVRNKQLSYAEAMRRLKLLTNRPPQILPTASKFTFSPLNRERALAAIDADERFVRAVAPIVLKLKRTANFSADDELRSRMDWMDCVLAPAINRVWYHTGTENSRQAAADLIADIVPEDFPTRALGSVIFQPRAFPLTKIRILKNKQDPTQGFDQYTVGIDPNEALPLLSSLTNSYHRHLKLYALLGNLNYRFTDYGDPIDKKISLTTGKRELWEGTQEIIDLAKQTPSAERRIAGGPLQWEYDYALSAALLYRQRWELRLVDGSSNKNRPEKEPGFGRLKVEKLDINPPLVNNGARWVGDGPDHDLIYDARRVYRLDREGESMLISPKDGYDFLDEEFIWKLRSLGDDKFTATLHDRSGSEFLRNEPIDLPPCDEWKAISVGKRKGVIIGKIKESGETWCALLELKDDKPVVQVFHEAREPYVHRYGNDIKEVVERANHSPRTQIDYTWHVLGTDRNGPILLVGRQGLSPLRIDLNTLEVKVSDLDASLFYNRNYQLRDIVIANQKLYMSNGHVTENDLNSPSIEPKMIIGSDHMEQVWAGNAPSGSENSGILIHDEWLVLPGYTWYRYNLYTEVTERLVPSSLPKEFVSDMGAYSSIHGFILWTPRYDGRPGRLHRVTILPE